MHWQAFAFVQSIRAICPDLFYDKRILEFGSHTVNYSIKELFLKTETYIGVDLSIGKTVDVVAAAQDVYLGNEFDVVISCECFEHNPYFHKTFTNMYHHAGNNGIVIFTCPTTGRPEHGTSRTDLNDSPGTASLGWDYYKNLTADDFDPVFIKNSFEHHLFIENVESHDLYFVGFKRKIDNAEHKFNFLKKNIKICNIIGNEYTKFWSKQENSVTVQMHCIL